MCLSKILGESSKFANIYYSKKIVLFSLDILKFIYIYYRGKHKGN